MKKYQLIALILFFVALLPRITDLGNTPYGLNWDETAYAYDAYSIMKTGKDQWGTAWPLWLTSFGEYKPAIGSYILIPALAVFGPHNWAVRVTPVVLNSLAVAALFGIVLRQTKKPKTAFIVALLMAVTPWHIHFSRTVLDPSIAFPFVLFGVYGLLSKRSIVRFFGFFFLLLSMWAYNAERLFVPLFLLWWYFSAFDSIQRKKCFKKNWVSLMFFIFGAVLLIIETVWGKAGTRATQVSIFTSETVRQIADETARSFTDVPIASTTVAPVTLFFARIYAVAWQYSRYFRPDFLFFKEGWLNNSPLFGYPGRGALLEVWLLLVPTALVRVVRKRMSDTTKFWLMWLALSALPGALSADGPHPGRSLLMVPALVYFLTLGWQQLAAFFKHRIAQHAVQLVLWTVTAISFSTWLVSYTTVYASSSVGYWQGQYKEVAEWIQSVAPKRQPVYISDVPDEHLLLFYAWYTQTDPAAVQAGKKNVNDPPIELLSVSNLYLLKEGMISSCTLPQQEVWYITTENYAEKIAKEYPGYTYQPIRAPESLSSWSVTAVRPEFFVSETWAAQQTECVSVLPEY